MFRGQILAMHPPRWAYGLFGGWGMHVIRGRKEGMENDSNSWAPDYYLRNRDQDSYMSVQSLTKWVGDSVCAI